MITMAPELEPKAVTGRSSSTIKKFDTSEKKYKNFSIDTGQFEERKLNFTSTYKLREIIRPGKNQKNKKVLPFWRFQNLGEDKVQIAKK